MVRRGSPVRVRLRAYVAEAVLVIREGAEAGREVTLAGALTIGRADDADLVLADPGISRNHARLLAAPGGAVTIEDLGSSNGTFVNGEPVSGSQALREGDEIQLGGALLQFVGGSGETQVMDPDATVAHPGPAGAPPPPQAEPSFEPPPRPAARPGPPPPPRRRPIPQPEPAAPTARDEVDDWNLPALAAIVLGPLSIVLLIFSSGSGFYAALPIAISAIALGTIGRNKVDRGESSRYRSLASAGRTFGAVGTILAAIILIALIVITQALDVSAENLDELVQEVRDEIENR
jgi:pSer/pThr/pTyr-binding forkhead associated (FHA) protein